MAASFEFLANFEDWRQESRQQPAKMDACPFPSDRDSFERRIAHAELLKTLTAYDETAGPARDGSSGKKKEPEVGGFPRLVNGKQCGLAGWNGWEDWLLPTPSILRRLPDGSCLIRLEVTLQSPFFSRDDRSFYPTENVLKRHHVFLTPCLAASGLKGLLRWAWNMSGGSPEDAVLLFGEAADAPGGFPAGAAPLLARLLAGYRWPGGHQSAGQKHGRGNHAHQVRSRFAGKQRERLPAAGQPGQRRAAPASFAQARCLASRGARRPFGKKFTITSL